MHVDMHMDMPEYEMRSGVRGAKWKTPSDSSAATADRASSELKTESAAGPKSVGRGSVGSVGNSVGSVGNSVGSVGSVGSVRNSVGSVGSVGSG